MGEHILRRHRFARAAAAVGLAAVAAACSGDPQTAAPVILKGTVPERLGSAPAAPPLAAPKSAARRIVVRPGQSVSILAREYHVPKRAIIEANQLKPPYKIKIGQSLVIPGGADAPPVRPAIAAAQPPAPAAADHPKVIPLDEPPASPKSTAHEAVAAAKPRPPAGPDRKKPEVIPLSERALAAKSAAPKITFPPPAAPSSAKAPPETPADEKPRPETATSEREQPRGRHFPWPVHGRILASYGTAQGGGGHNDGINIGAPRGAAVRAIDSGVVAYAGNEIRGYGNLVLVKHRNGFISAYAHCEELLVKRGDKVGRGQVIAKVGDTGGVSEPQLHFELRRGKRAVNPREFLAPTSSAGASEAGKRG